MRFQQYSSPHEKCEYKNPNQDNVQWIWMTRIKLVPRPEHEMLNPRPLKAGTISHAPYKTLDIKSRTIRTSIDHQYQLGSKTQPNLLRCTVLNMFVSDHVRQSHQLELTRLPKSCGGGKQVRVETFLYVHEFENAPKLSPGGDARSSAILMLN